MKLNEIPRTATFAWSSDLLPLLATGTVAGAMDANFDSLSNLEIWEAFSDTPLFSATVDNRFYNVAWSQSLAKYPRGIIAAAFENGTITFYDADKLIKNKDLAAATVHSATKHTGRVRALAFNPINHHILASAGANGEIFVWDTSSWAEPSTPAQATPPRDEVVAVAWNHVLPHVLATCGGGDVSVWDVSGRKKVALLLHGSARLARVAWHPTLLTRLVTAGDGDSHAAVMTWNLRNLHEPEREMHGHRQGVLSVDWCARDALLLLTSGKDNATYLWNPETGTRLASYPSTANWAFETRFAPSAPDVFATASFDGRIVVQLLQDTSKPAPEATATDDNAFWSSLATGGAEHPVVEAIQAPRWMARPASVSFGFGSKIVVVRSQNGASTVDVQRVATALPEDATALRGAMANDDFAALVEDKKGADWDVLRRLAKVGRRNVIEGEKKEDDKKADDKKDDEKDEKKEDEKKEGDKENVKSAPDSTLDDAAFFEKLGDGFLEESFRPSGEFTLPKSELAQRLLAKDIEGAVGECLRQGKLTEALVLALDAPSATKSRVKNAYFSAEKTETARLVYLASVQDIGDVVAHADVALWRDIAAAVRAYAKEDGNDSEFSSKMVALAERLRAKDERDAAVACFVAGGALDGVAAVWMDELAAEEERLVRGDGDVAVQTPADARFAALTALVEKIAAYRSLAGLKDVLTDATVSKAVVEFASLAAGGGDFELAGDVLGMVAKEHGGGDSERIREASQTKTSAKASQAKASQASRTAVPQYGAPSHVRSAVPPYGATPAVPQTSTPTPYGASAAKPARAASAYGAAPSQYGAPATPAPPAAPFGAPAPSFGAPAPAPFGAPAAPFSAPSAPGVPSVPSPAKTPRASNPYAPSAAGNGSTTGATQNAYAPTASAYAPPTGSVPNNGYAPPVNAFAPSAPSATGYGFPPAGPSTPGIPSNVSVPPPPKPVRDNGDGWNDLPETFKPKASARRAAPAATIPAAAAPTTPQMAPQGSFAPPKKIAVPQGQSTPPPPKGPSRTASTALVNVAPRAPPSASAPPSGPTPPSAPGTPKNPYAPTNPPLGGNPLGAPPLGGSVNPIGGNPLGAPSAPSFGTPPPKNPYAPAPGQVGQSVPVAPSVAPVAPPPKGPAKSGSHGPVSAPPQASAPPQGPMSVPPPSAPAAKYPPGDRSHIPSEALPIYEDFSAVLAAIKPEIPEKYQRHATDMESRLNHLYDHLNNEELVTAPTIALLREIGSSLRARQFAEATALLLQVSTAHPDEVGTWHIGVKRLITMAEAMMR